MRLQIQFSVRRTAGKAKSRLNLVPVPAQDSSDGLCDSARLHLDSDVTFHELLPLFIRHLYLFSITDFYGR